MSTERIEITRALRQLIRVMRTDRARMTQRAAGHAAGLSEIWWRQIESGHTDYATADALARMSYVVGVRSEQLRRIGQDLVADLVDIRVGVLGGERPADEMEAHIMNTPGLSAELCAALLAMAKVLKSAASDQ